jgi:hypothetical protein
MLRRVAGLPVLPRMDLAAADDVAVPAHDRVRGYQQPQPVVALCVPTTSSTSCDQPIFVDHATDVSVFSDAVQVEIDWLG